MAARQRKGSWEGRAGDLNNEKNAAVLDMDENFWDKPIFFAVEKIEKEGTAACGTGNACMLTAAPVRLWATLMCAIPVAQTSPVL